MGLGILNRPRLYSFKAPSKKENNSYQRLRTVLRQVQGRAGGLRWESACYKSRRTWVQSPGPSKDNYGITSLIPVPGRWGREDPQGSLAESAGSKPVRDLDPKNKVEEFLRNDLWLPIEGVYTCSQVLTHMQTYAHIEPPIPSKTP